MGLLGYDRKANATRALNLDYMTDQKTTRIGKVMSKPQMLEDMINFLEKNSVIVNDKSLYRHRHVPDPVDPDTGKVILDLTKHERDEKGILIIDKKTRRKICKTDECQHEPLRFYTLSKKGLYFKFRREHQEYWDPRTGKFGMSKTTFNKRFPFNYCKAKPRACLCPYEEQTKEYMKSMFDACKKQHEDCDCVCDFCKDERCNERLKNMCEGDNFYNLMREVLCPPVDGVQLSDNKPVFKEKCITGECPACGFKKSDFFNCPKNDCRNMETEVTFMRYDYRKK